MKKQLHASLSSHDREGSAFITAMIVVFIVSMTAGSFYAFSSNSVYQSRRLTDTIRAKAIAEAGANEAISLLVMPGQYGLRHDGDNFGETSFAGGSYEVAVDNGDDPDSGRVLLTSIGRYGLATAVVGVDMRDQRRESRAGFEDPPATWRDFALFANGNMTYNGSPTIDGDLHTNNDFKLSGNWTSVEGMVSSLNGVSIPEAYRGVWQLIPFPALSDPEFQAFLAAYEAAGGTVNRENGNQTWPGDKVLSGITIVTGNVTFRGAGDRFINGMLYATGTITANGSGTLTLEGSMLSGGSITFNGVAGVFSHAAIGDGGGGGEGETGEEMDAAAQTAIYAMWQGSGS